MGLGSFLVNRIDAPYATAIREGIGGVGPIAPNDGLGMARRVAGQALGATMDQPFFTGNHQGLNRATYAAALAARYGLPLAGTTAAGVGLVELIELLGGAEVEQEQPDKR